MRIDCVMVIMVMGMIIMVVMMPVVVMMVVMIVVVIMMVVPMINRLQAAKPGAKGITKRTVRHV